MKSSNPVILLGSLLLSGLVSAAHVPSQFYNASVPRWEWWPNPGPLANGDKGQYLNLSSGVDLWYTTFGKNSSRHTPVLLLHGGTGNSNQMYNQANKLAETRQVILQDTRGEGRSPYINFTTFHYDDFTRDAIAILDHLNIPRVAVVGWSDGAIVGLDLAMNYSSRIERVFAHGANPQANMGIPGLNDPIINSKTGSLDSDFATNGTTYSVNGKRNLKKREKTYDCESLSPLPGNCTAMEEGVATMWSTEPTWGPEALAEVKCPVWIVDGDHDTSVERNQADAMAAWIPFAGQLILPQVGHAALLEDPKFFNFAMEYFLDMKFDSVLPYY
ncbi:alpha/beta-hydrolase [Stipitochalara longipes BDJ]|nr:alpha/beta-hydrolase [Stipitochalara longipes BDJ]